MTIRPIIFSGPMVRALLDGRKMQTRRIIKPQPAGPVWVTQARLWLADLRGKPPLGLRFAPDDLLYVRESFAYVGGGDPGILLFAATWQDDARRAGCDEPFPIDAPRWTPSIHMPRAISRLTLEVTGVKVERVWDISEVDATAEGCAAAPCARCDESGVEPSGEHKGHPCEDCGGRGKVRGVDAFRTLWNNLNEKRGFGWAANPWVAAVTFRVHPMNVDQLISLTNATAGAA